MESERGIASGTILYDEYRVIKVLGEGGFGITYLAEAIDDGETVAVKEYFPITLAVREKNSWTIKAFGGKRKEEYLRGKRCFIRESSILMEYPHLQGIVNVWDCFECNNTAYIVMDYIDGITMREYISSHGRVEYQELIEMLSPIMKSLVTLHKHGVIHRDISPDNLMIGMDNQLYLIDFGAAKKLGSVTSKTNTVLLKAGFAPPEQYMYDGNLGAWSDVYALCATIYTALCGKIPIDAVARLQGKELVPLTEYGITLEEWQWNAILKGMNMRAAERYRDMGELYDALTLEPSAEDAPTVIGQEADPALWQQIRQLNNERQADAKIRPKRGTRSKKGAAFAVSFLLIIIFFAGFWWVNRERMEQQKENAGQTKDVVTQPERLTEEILSEKDDGGESSLQLCSMPDVLGKTEQEAKSEIAAVDEAVKVRITRSYSDTVAYGIVMEQNMAPNTQYNKGAIKEVVLTVSDGKQPDAKQDTTAPVVNQHNPTTESYKVNSDGNEPIDFYLGE